MSQVTGIAILAEHYRPVPQPLEPSRNRVGIAEQRRRLAAAEIQILLAIPYYRPADFSAIQQSLTEFPRVVYSEALGALIAKEQVTLFNPACTGMWVGLTVAGRRRHRAVRDGRKRLAEKRGGKCR